MDNTLKLTIKIKKLSDRIKPLSNRIKDDSIPIAKRQRMFQTQWLPLHTELTLLESTLNLLKGVK